MNGVYDSEALSCLLMEAPNCLLVEAPSCLLVEALSCLLVKPLSCLLVEVLSCLLVELLSCLLVFSQINTIVACLNLVNSAWHLGWAAYQIDDTGRMLQILHLPNYFVRAWRDSQVPLVSRRRLSELLVLEHW